MQERSSLTTFNKLRPEQSLTDKRGEREGGGQGVAKGAPARLGSRFCACAELADVFVNMLTLQLTQRVKYALAFRH